MTVWLNGHTCLNCGEGWYDGYASENLTIPCNKCGHQAPASMSNREFHTHIEQRNTSQLTPDQLHLMALGLCPDCRDPTIHDRVSGGVLLRGPYDDNSQHFTRRDCKMDFIVFGIFTRGQRVGINERLACYHDPKFPERNCDGCGEPYTGPAVYCCFGCAWDDA